MSFSLAKRYIELAAEIKIEEFVLSYLKLNLEDSRLTSRRRISALKVIDPPFVPERRTWPKRKQIVMISTIDLVGY